MITLLKDYEQSLIAGGKPKNGVFEWADNFVKGALGSVVFAICQDIADRRINGDVGHRVRLVLFSGIAWGLIAPTIDSISNYIAAKLQTKSDSCQCPLLDKN